MKHHVMSLRTFIGAVDFEESRAFYRDLGFEESIISNDMSFFKVNGLGFYLQNYYVEDWVNNSMIFLEVDNVARYWDALQSLDLPVKYQSVKLIPIKEYEWGRECFVVDPSGVLWHFGEFY